MIYRLVDALYRVKLWMQSLGTKNQRDLCAFQRQLLTHGSLGGVDMSWQQMSLPQWLQHIEQCSPHVMDFGLSRMQDMLARLAITPEKLGYVITVAGTNGKGSTVALLEACLSAAGVRVGAYTSPHLCSVTERIRLQQQDIHENQLINALQVVEAQRQQLPLTYFEFMTLAALWQFQQAQLHVVILEVGLGGRLDAVNVIDADLAIITSIGLDHQAYLGNTLADIAIEKCGVLRADQPAVYGGDQVIDVIAKQAQQIGARLCTRPAFGAHKKSTDQWDWQGQDSSGQPLFWQGLPLPSILLDNAACTLQAMQLLPDHWRPNRTDIARGLSQVKVMGRLQWLSNNMSHNILLDVAHNPAAIAKVIDYLAELDVSRFNRVIAVFGVMADKDWPTMLDQLGHVVNAWMPVQLPDARALPRELLVDELRRKGCAILSTSIEVEHLVTSVCSLAQADDLILVLGSFAVVGPFLQQFDFAKV